MDRLIIKSFVSWKNQSNRKPLIVRGARQVGKSYSILGFGKQYFKGRVHIIDFEQRTDWHRIFDLNLDIVRITTELEILLNEKIEPGKDLLFFDEIQACPRALLSLRYFYEQNPQLHVIAAGSLLEFELKDISFPVGRVQIINMYPMNFVEYLMASNLGKLGEVLLKPFSRLSPTIHQTLTNELKRYFFIGGMPECVNHWINSKSMKEVFNIQADLVNTYRQDFSKYAQYSNKRCLNAVVNSVAKNIGRQIKYTHLSDEFSGTTIKKAFELLNLARFIHRVSSASPSGLPLSTYVSERKFKAIFVDIGLMRHITGMAVDVEYQHANLLQIYKGAMAEQFVGQEFISTGIEDIYYWSRDSKSSQAEVDYLFDRNGNIFPVEVKSGVSGRLRSMHLLLQSYHNCSRGYVLSDREYSELPEQNLAFLPLYYAYSLALEHDVSF